MKSLHKFLSRLMDPVKITVVGDGMVDSYYDVQVNRISPEFPIVIFLSGDDNPYLVVCGGAANVCYQFTHFKTKVRYFGFVDPYSKSIFEELGICTDGCIGLPDGLKIPVKKRIYQREFPMCRWDVEKPNYGMNDKQLKECQEKLFQKLGEDKSEVVIFSDYNKGMFHGLKQVPIPQDCISIVDPKNGPLSKWRGCTVFKPNAKEAFELTKLSDWRQQCQKIQEEVGCVAVVITQGSEGVVGKIGELDFEYKPNRIQEANSVIGAGDCFLSVLALSQAFCMDLIEGVKVAWQAGALYVQKKHNTPVSAPELSRHFDPVFGKIVKPEWLALRNFKITFCNGVFDLLHPGHLHLIQYAKEIGNQVVVAVNSDSSVKRLKGEGRPVIGLEARMNALANLGCVDYVVSFDEDTPYELIKRIAPDVLVKGEPYKANEIVGSNIVKDVRICPMLGGFSTTGIIGKMKG